MQPLDNLMTSDLLLDGSTILPSISISPNSLTMTPRRGTFFFFSFAAASLVPPPD